jgi:hypothetical protein
MGRLDVGDEADRLVVLIGIRMWWPSESRNFAAQSGRGASSNRPAAASRLSTSPGPRAPIRIDKGSALDHGP